jgi:LysR family hydrogen peroxide-inducible transcriptional activator
VAIVEHQSFSKAALQLHVSVSTISEQVQKFERRMGKVLLNRNRRRIVPTKAGEVLYRGALEILEDLKKLEQEVQDLDGRREDKAEVAFSMTVAPCFVSHVLKSFDERSAKARMVVHRPTAAQMLAMLDEGKLDVGITSLPIRENGFDKEVLFSEEMLVALHPSHPLVRKQKIFKDDLASEKFIVSKEDHCLGVCGLQLCRGKKSPPCIVFQNGPLATIQDLVASGKGISLVPQTALPEAPADIIFRRLENSPIKRSIAIVTRSKHPLTTAAQTFLDHVRQTSRTFQLPVAQNGTKDESLGKAKVA